MPEIGGHQLHSSRIYDELFAARQHNHAQDSLIAIEDTLIVDVKPSFPMPCDTTEQVIMLCGDSMLEGLGPRLAAYAEANGHTLYTVMWYSSTSEVWGKSDKLKHYINKLRPTYIVLCLGANELIVSDIVNKREKYVSKIIEDIDTIPFLWIGPPNWRKDTGINDLIASKAPQGTFFLSDGMNFVRTKDGAHPTRNSAAEWLDSVVRWMPANALYPIRLNIPEKNSGKAAQTFIHQPNEQ